MEKWMNEEGLPKAAPMDRVRIGFVGVGGMGSNHIRNLLRVEGVEIRAVCDINEAPAARIQQMVREAGQPEPVAYTRGDRDYVRMCESADLDLVYTATPWELHTPICLAAMNNGKHVCTEVPAAVTIEECWQLVETAEKTGRYCTMMENCCYDRAEMMVLNMTRRGVFGELLHAECGYMHDLRETKTTPSGEGLWRTAHSILRNGNLYPTHGLGPVAQCMNINRGEQFDYLVSMSGKSRGLNLFAERQHGPDHPLARQKYALADVNVSLIRTLSGMTITLYHDCSSPRPYSRALLMQGTQGIYEGYPDRIYLEGVSPRREAWEPLENYADRYEHPLWRALKDQLAQAAGHGGMDWLEEYRMIGALRAGTSPDMDVYDAAAWSAVAELTERSVASRSSAVDFPDFTRGRWRDRPPLGIVEPD